MTGPCSPRPRRAAGPAGHVRSRCPPQATLCRSVPRHLVPTSHLDSATSPEMLLSPGCQQHPTTLVRPGGCRSHTLLPGAGKEGAAPRRCRAGPSRCRYGFWFIQQQQCQLSLRRCLAAWGGMHGTHPRSSYQGGRDAAPRRGSVQMCHHSWEQNAQHEQLLWSCRAPQKPKPGCTASLPTHRPPWPWACRAAAMVPRALGCPQAATTVSRLPPSRVRAPQPALAGGFSTCSPYAAR